MPRTPWRSLTPRAHPRFTLVFSIVLAATVLIAGVVILRINSRAPVHAALPDAPVSDPIGSGSSAAGSASALVGSGSAGSGSVLEAPERKPPRRPRPTPGSLAVRLARYRDLLASVDIVLHGIRFDLANRYRGATKWPIGLSADAMRARLATIATLARDARPPAPADRAALAYVAALGDLRDWEDVIRDAPGPDASDLVTPRASALFERFGAVSLALRAAVPPFEGDGIEDAVARCRAPADRMAAIDHASQQAERAAPSIFTQRPAADELGRLGRACLVAIAAADELDPDAFPVRDHLISTAVYTFGLRDRTDYLFMISTYAFYSANATEKFEAWRDAP